MEKKQKVAKGSSPVKTDFVKGAKKQDAFNDMNQRIKQNITERKKNVAKILKHNKTSRHNPKGASQSPRTPSVSPRVLQEPLDHMQGKHEPPRIDEEAELTLRAKELVAARMLRRSKAIHEMDLNRRRRELAQKKEADSQKHAAIAEEVRRRTNPSIFDVIGKWAFGSPVSTLRRRRPSSTHLGGSKRSRARTRTSRVKK